MHSIVLQRFFTIIKCQQHRVRKKTNCNFFLCGMFIVCYDLAYPTWKGLNNNGYSATTRTTGQCYQLKNKLCVGFFFLLVMKVPINTYPKNEIKKINGMWNFAPKQNCFPMVNWVTVLTIQLLPSHKLEI